ncbi:MAG: aminotransferase class I/II-fold pyridoxal phosphate-dependent enzyme [Rhodospirillales bacterium]|nr:aminotransferase class I/II-fold pyridoxal phosphate-dependent enzyme [Rhodospirillales bacterium]
MAKLATVDTTAGRTVFTKDLSAPDPVPEEGIEAALGLMRDGRLFRYGEDRSGLPEAALFEEEFARTLGVRYAVGLNSGGCALFVALKAAGVAPGDTVLVNAFTLAPVPGAIAHAGAVPVLVEITPSYVIDLDDLERKAAASGARVLLLSYMRGHLPDMDRVLELCRRLDLTLIEDCAHTMGATWDGRLSGTFGKAACFSAQTFKHINAGEGGILATDDPDLAAKAVLLSGSYMLYAQHKARPELEVFERHKYSTPNCSMRMSNLVGALLRPQLATLEERIARWRRIHGRLAAHFAEIAHITVPPRPAKEAFVPSSIQFSVTGLSAEEIRAFLEDCERHGVHIKWFGTPEPVGFTSTPAHWRYLPVTPDLPASDAVFRGLCDIRLPPSLTDEDCDALAAVLRQSMHAVTGSRS